MHSNNAMGSYTIPAFLFFNFKLFMTPHHCDAM